MKRNLSFCFTGNHFFTRIFLGELEPFRAWFRRIDGSKRFHKRSSSPGERMAPRGIAYDKNDVLLIVCFLTFGLGKGRLDIEFITKKYG